MMLLKTTLFGVMFTRFEVQKKDYFPHTVHYCCPASETCRFVQSSSFLEARRALIGQLSSML